MRTKFLISALALVCLAVAVLFFSFAIVGPTKQPTIVPTTTPAEYTWTPQTALGRKCWVSIASSSDGKNLAACASNGYIYTSSDGADLVMREPYDYIYTSTDYGKHWTQQTGSGIRNWRSITSSSTGKYLVACERYGFIYTSNDSGTTWTERKLSDGQKHYWSAIALSGDGRYLIACERRGYIYTLTHSGAKWIERRGPGHGQKNWSSSASSISGEYLAACGKGGNIWTSADYGLNWIEQRGAGIRNWISLASSSTGEYLAACVKGGSIWTSANFGANWREQTGAGTRNWLAITSSSDGRKLTACELCGSIYVSIDYGETWTEQTTRGGGYWYAITSSSDGRRLAACEAPAGFIHTGISTNRAPVITLNPTGNQTINEGQLLTIRISATDPDGNPLTYSAETLPSGALFGFDKKKSAQVFTWKPDYSQAGTNNTKTYGVKFKVTDGEFSVSKDVLITVNNTNCAPVANAQTVATNEDAAKAIVLTGSDVDGSALTYTIVTNPAHGTLSGSGASKTYTPSANYNGTDSFTFKVNDGTVDSVPATVSITVSPVNDAPVANSQSVTSLVGSIKLTGSDPDQRYNLKYTITSQPSRGQLSYPDQHPDGLFVSYWPNSLTDIGTDSFTFKVTDPEGVDSNIATVRINIT